MWRAVLYSLARYTGALISQNVLRHQDLLKETPGVTTSLS